jgi:DNA polymerase
VNPVGIAPRRPASRVVRAAPGGPVRVTLQRASDAAEWRDAARRLLAQDTDPARVEWQDAAAAQASLFTTGDPATDAAPVVADAGADPWPWPAPFGALARRVLCHREPGRHALLYRVAWRLRREPRLLDLAADPDVARLHALDREVRRAAHKMKAFVRFRKRSDADVYVAWFDPGHPLLHALARFFVGRFASLRWIIVTPDASASWDGERLAFGPGAPRPAAPAADPCEDLWRTYYASIFNPARLKLRAMRREMPRRYWRDLPEAVLIPQLAADATRRTAAMLEADATLGVRAAAARCGTLDALAAAVQACRACPVGCRGTRAVAGEGPSGARLMLVGEQPGDAEEHAGRPFVGPAGAVLQQALDAAGVRRDDAYLTNAVKHFGFQQRQGRRLHRSPDRRTIEHCRWWLLRERELVEPVAVVALGRTALAALLGPDVAREAAGSRAPVTTHETSGGRVITTRHPAHVLRAGDAAARAESYAAIVAALRTAAGR